MSKGKLTIDLEIDTEQLLTSEEYGITLQDELLNIVKDSLRTEVKRMAQAKMRSFVKSYLNGKCKVETGEDGKEYVLVPLLLEDIKHG